MASLPRSSFSVLSLTFLDQHQINARPGLWRMHYHDIEMGIKRKLSVAEAPVGVLDAVPKHHY